MDVYGKFVKGSIILSLTAGCSLGAFLIATIGFSQYWKAVEHSIIQAHGHVQIFGWVGLMIMGVAYHVIPRFKATRLYSDNLANASFVLLFIGIVLRALIQPIAQDTVLFAGMIASGVLEVSAVSFFAIIILRTIKSSKQNREPFEMFIVGGTVWFLVQTIVTMALSSYLSSQGLAEIPSAIDGAYLHMQIFGFIFMFILGVTLRTLPMFLGLKETNTTLIKISFATLNIGIILRILGDWSKIIYASPLWNPIVALSAGLEFLGVIAFILGLNLFRKPAVDMSDLDVDRSYEKFIKIAYVWLPISVSML